MMLTEVCAEIKNYFCQDGDRIGGDFTVQNGRITPSISLQENQYYRIVGSVFNDGVHKNGDELIDEEQFHGAVWKMRVPKDFLDLVDAIEAWNEVNGKVDSAAMSPFSSESFGGYSYTKSGSGSGGGSSSVVTWKDAFSARLNKYRKIRAV